MRHERSPKSGPVLRSSLMHFTRKTYNLSSQLSCGRPFSAKLMHGAWISIDVPAWPGISHGPGLATFELIYSNGGPKSFCSKIKYPILQPTHLKITRTHSGVRWSSGQFSNENTHASA